MMELGTWIVQYCESFVRSIRTSSLSQEEFLSRPPITTTFPLLSMSTMKNEKRKFDFTPQQDYIHNNNNNNNTFAALTPNQIYTSQRTFD
jgi:hypothetical protein